MLLRGCILAKQDQRAEQAARPEVVRATSPNVLHDESGVCCSLVGSDRRGSVHCYAQIKPVSAGPVN